MSKGCKDCPNRHTACWNTCEVYKEYVAKNEQIRAARHKDDEVWGYAQARNAQLKARMRRDALRKGRKS